MTPEQNEIFEFFLLSDNIGNRGASSGEDRITEDDEIRLTEDGETRILE